MNLSRQRDTALSIQTSSGKPHTSTTLISKSETSFHDQSTWCCFSEPVEAVQVNDCRKRTKIYTEVEVAEQCLSPLPTSALVFNKQTNKNEAWQLACMSRCGVALTHTHYSSNYGLPLAQTRAAWTSCFSCRFELKNLKPKQSWGRETERREERHTERGVCVCVCVCVMCWGEWFVCFVGAGV